jgi:hypothetical protein
LAEIKKELENKINNSPYFTITGENMQAAKDTAYIELIEAIWKYYKDYRCLTKDESLEYYVKYAYEIDEAILACLEPGIFHPERGTPFIHYLNTSIKHRIDRRKITYGKECSLFGTVEAPCFYENFDEAIVNNDLISRCFATIDEVFKNMQERVQPYRRMLVTLEFIDALADIADLNQNYSFIDYEMLEAYKTDKKKPTQRSIADKFNRNESDASRTLSEFMEKINSVCNKYL